MPKIKIVHVTQSLGGVKTYIEHLIKHSDREMFEYVIIAPEHTEFQEFCKNLSIEYYPIKSQRGINFFKDIISLYRVVSKLKELRPDMLHVHSAKGGITGRFAARLLNIKVIYSPHAFSYLSFTGLKRMIFFSFECLARPFTDVLLSVSHSEFNRAVHEVGFEPDKVKVILNAIPMYDSTPLRNYKNCDQIGMIARLTEQKNPILFLNVALELLKIFPHLSFSILGAGMTDNLAVQIQDFIVKHKLSDKVKILNWGDNHTSETFLNGLDVFLLTSVFEGLPFSLVEAMASGLPCVASKVDGNTDVINNNENGFSCLSIDEFAVKVLSLVRSEDLRRHIGQAGHRYVREMHDIHLTIKQLEKIYMDVYNIDKPVLVGKVNLNPAVEYRSACPGI